mmetsp:Transcript_72431/g.192574  ORF Transcript_72431/g.192574 Transcript_72431/m.192574 type:complete len:207 (+) Transcript_72431:252-872(+)
MSRSLRCRDSVTSGLGYSSGWCWLTRRSTAGTCSRRHRSSSSSCCAILGPSPTRLSRCSASAGTTNCRDGATSTFAASPQSNSRNNPRCGRCSSISGSFAASRASRPPRSSIPPSSGVAYSRVAARHAPSHSPPTPQPRMRCPSTSRGTSKNSTTAARWHARRGPPSRDTPIGFVRSPTRSRWGHPRRTAARTRSQAASDRGALRS